jgi:hypothetical protein
MAGSNLPTFGFGNVYANPYDWSQTTQYNSSNTSNSGKKNMAFGIDDILLSAGLSAIGGIGSAFGANSQANGQIQAAAINAQQQGRATVLNGLTGLWAATGGSQFQADLQKKAADYQLAFLEPRKMQLASQERQTGIADALSPGAQKLRWQQNADKLNYRLAEIDKQMSGLFGPIQENPYSYGRMPSYATTSFG